MDFFWSDRHWVRAAVLYLSEEGGQGLVDIAAKMASFQLSWTGDNPGLGVFKEPLFPQHSVSEAHSTPQTHRHSKMPVQPQKHIYLTLTLLIYLNQFHVHFRSIQEGISVFIDD